MQFVSAVYVEVILVKWRVNSRNDWQKCSADKVVSRISPALRAWKSGEKTSDNSSGCKTVLRLTSSEEMVGMCVYYMLFLGIWVDVCTCREANEEKRERAIFHTHIWGFTWPPPSALLPRCGVSRPAIQRVCFSFHHMLGSCSLLRSSLWHSPSPLRGWAALSQ